MRGTGYDNILFENSIRAVVQLGPNGVAQAFVNAAKMFAENKDNEPLEERPEPMSAAVWKKLLIACWHIDGAPEEEDDEEEQESEEDASEAGEADEPPKKKAKTD